MTTENKRYIDNVECKVLEESDEFPHGGFEAILSTDAVDRDGEVVEAGAFDPLPEYWPALADHTASIATTVGWGVPRYEGGKLYFRGPFDADPFSQLVRSKLKSRSIRSMSVGFMSAKRVMKDGRPHVTTAEGLEGSFVVIPSNREALVQSAKTYGKIEAPTGSFEERQQAIWEALNTLHPDAWCSTIATYPDRVIYSIENYQDRENDGNYEMTYTVDVDGNVSMTGAATAVEITQTVSPKALEAFARKAGRRNSTIDQDALNMAHDALVTAGAECTATQEDDAVDKSKNPIEAKTTETDIDVEGLDDIDAELEALEIEAELDEIEDDDGLLLDEDGENVDES